MSGREQFMSREEGKNVLILSPLTGRAVPLEEVPDPVFSQKMEWRSFQQRGRS